MKKIWLVGLCIAALAVPALASAQVETSMGALQLGGKIKWTYAFMPEDEDAKGAGAAGQLYGFDGAAVETFYTSNAELDIVGAVGEKVAYLIELQAANSNPGWVSNPNEMGWVGVRQAKIVISDVIPLTQVTVGSFNLPVTNYQPRATNDYDLILLPLINTVGVIGAGYPGATAPAYAPIGLGWQATGVNLAISPIDYIELDLAYFNGYAGANTNMDMDLQKSYLVNLKIMPSNFLVSLGWLYESWDEPAGFGGVHDSNTYVLSAAYGAERFEANLDFTYGMVSDYQLDDDGDEADLSWMGYQVTAGYWFTDAFEVIGRYEWIDPNLANDADYGAGEITENDQLTWLTIGLNWRMNESAETSVNYIIRSEQGSKIDMEAGEVGNKYQAINNDLLLIQVQVWQ